MGAYRVEFVRKSMLPRGTYQILMFIIWIIAKRIVPGSDII
jgi:hypothetical protein